LKQFVILRASHPGRGEALSDAARSFGERAGWPPPAAVSFRGAGFRQLMVWGRDAADVLDQERGEAAVTLALATFDDRGERLAPRALLDRVVAHGSSALAGIAAPQSVVLAFGTPVQVLVSTDHVGLQAVYHYSEGDTAAAGSSSRLLAEILRCPLDEGAVGAFAVLGEYAATDTPFRHVHRLDAGRCIKLEDGGLALDRYCPRIAPRARTGDVDATVREGVHAVRAGVDACRAAYPAATMELSGGLDSRVILAALLATDHRPAEAITLGEPGHPDMVVAATLAARVGVPHRRVDLSDMGMLSAAEALQLVDTAGRRRDYSGNCVALGVLDWVEATAGTKPRLSGQNGELARGFYYPLQPPWPRTTKQLARTLVHWRLMANERVSHELFSPDVRAAGERRALQTTQAFLEGTGCDWLRATDMLYLGWRMQRWVGGDWSAAARTRPVLAPFFHPRYIDWALSSPPRLKRGSRLLARVLDAMEPDLAQLPLAGGDAPTAIFRPHLADRVSHARRTANKAVVKLRQRLGASATPPTGAPVLAALALEAMVAERQGLERVARLSFVSPAYVERVAESRTASPTTVGLLAALRGLAIDEAAARSQHN
jgi:asparagine synthase (glutamine-hydrolysing)